MGLVKFDGRFCKVSCAVEMQLWPEPRRLHGGTEYHLISTAVISGGGDTCGALVFMLKFTCCQSGPFLINMV